LIVPGVAVAVPAATSIVDTVVASAAAAVVSISAIVKMLAVFAAEGAVHETEKSASSVPSPSTSVETVVAAAYLRPATPVIVPKVSVTSTPE